MFKDNRKDIHDLDYGYLGIFKNKIKALVIGGGKVGYMKAVGLKKQNIEVTVISDRFVEEFNNQNINLIYDYFSEKYIDKYHFFIVAVKDYKHIKEILDKNLKLYVICSNSFDGNLFVPMIVKEKGYTLSITANGSPFGTRFLIKRVSNKIKKYDDFMVEMKKIREKVKGNLNKNTILEFIYSDDFYFFYKKEKHILVLEMFFGGFYD